MSPVTVESFRVDLRGIVDLFSHHLYSSPRVYVRELLQNAVDAISARRLVEPDAPASITLTTHGAGLTVTDTGTGLAPDQVRDLLATVGRSSKRDDWGFSRHEFMGQFGVGLLAAFLVADTVCVHSRAAGHPVVRWTADAAGSYVVDVGVEAPSPLFPEVGTTVTLTARPGAETWFDPRTVAELVERYGALLEVSITVDGTERPRGVAPWDPAGSSPAALLAYAQDHLGLTPFDSIPLVDRGAGLRGVAYVLPVAVNPAERPRHRVHLKRMLLSDSVDNLLPDWAYFVRATIDTTELRPTASREALFDDEELERTREVLGAAVRRWIVRLGTTRPDRLAAFLDVHQLGVKALALHDDEMLGLVHRWVPFETTTGAQTVEQVQRAGEVVRFVTSATEFRQVAQVAAARGLVIVNAGYVYDAALMARMHDVLGVPTTLLQPTDLRADLAPLDEEAARAAAPLLEVAARVLDPVGCDVAISTFEPAALPSLYLVDRAVRQSTERQRSRERVDALWGAVLDSLDTVAEPVRPQLVLNHRHPLVRRLLARADEPRTAYAVEAVYGQALLQGRHPLRPADQALLTRTMLGLLETDRDPDPETQEAEGDR